MKKFLEYTKFRKNYNFTMHPLIKENDKIYLNGELVEDETKKYFEGENFINAYSGSNVSIARVLSNLYPMEFKFRGKKVKSIEGVLQGVKYKDKHTQNLVLNYSGVNAYHIRACNEIDFWGNTGFLYWQGKAMKRDSEEYQLFIDELYFSASQNPLFARALLATGNKYLLHHIGRDNSQETVLTRYEYELRLNSLREYIKQKKTD